MKRFLIFVGLAGGFTLLAGVLVAGWGLYHYSRGLPDHAQLADYEPPIVTRLHAGDGRLLAEYASEKRVFVPVEAMPRLLLKAFISAEDQNFYHHHGVDFVGIARAVVQNLSAIGTNRRLIGASTITQQVAKNFLLTNEVSIDRKVREALLAIRLERALPKERILELYLNEIFLGQRSYGVAAAAQNYFDKSLDQLSLAEMAYLAALPKGPNNYHPVRRPQAAIERRNYVIGRMMEDGYIDQSTAQQSMSEPIEMHRRNADDVVVADFYAEEVRREIAERYGEAVLYEGGLSVRTCMDPRLQGIAQKVLRKGLLAYDRRHGWRGPVTAIDVAGDWAAELSTTSRPTGLGDWRLAVVLEISEKDATIGLADGTRGQLAWDGLKWARPWLPEQKVGAAPKLAADILALGDVVAVAPLPNDDSDTAETEQTGIDLYSLEQIPAIQGAIVALDPHNGRILAMTGGWSFDGSQFNRATQAARQPGSAFKPFVYLTALEQGLTPASIVLDAPFAIDQGAGLGKWRPQNYSQDFGGPSTLRLGIEKSRNLMTVRLANDVGMNHVVDVAKRFEIGNYPEQLSFSLGAGETFLIDLAAAYGMLVNGGKKVKPALVERIQDRHGKTIYRRDRRECADCDEPTSIPLLPDLRPVVTDPASAFQVTWMLKGVVDNGTGRRIRALGRPLAGKTGTTNDSFDAWFMGFAPDLVVGVFTGFDNPKTLGPKETGSSVAVPIFKDFMEEALGDQPPVPFRIPSGIRMVRIDAETGKLPTATSERVILEAFKPGTEPRQAAVSPQTSEAGPDDGPPVIPLSSFESGLY